MPKYITNVIKKYIKKAKDPIHILVEHLKKQQKEMKKHLKFILKNDW
jgi:CO dehydrogenase/acetyl-CoA synthase epsilon subunit